MVATLANELTQKLKRNEERKQKQQNVRSTHRAGYSEDRPSHQSTPQKRAHRGVSTKKQTHGTSSWSESQNTSQTRWSSLKKKFVLQSIDQIVFMIVMIFLLAIIYNGRQTFKQWVHSRSSQPLTIIFSAYNTTKEHIVPSWEKMSFQLFQSGIAELGNEPKISNYNGQYDDFTAISPNIKEDLLEGGLSITRSYPGTSIKPVYIRIIGSWVGEIGGLYLNETDLEKLLLEISLLHEDMQTAKSTYKDFLSNFSVANSAMSYSSNSLFINTQNTYNEFEEFEESTKKKRQYSWEILSIFSKKDQTSEVIVEEIKFLLQRHITFWFNILVELHEAAEEAVLHFKHLKRRISDLNLIMESHQNMLYDMMKKYPEHKWTNSLALFFNHENLTREAKGNLAEFLVNERISLNFLSLHDHDTRATAIIAALGTIMENCNTLTTNCYEISNYKEPVCSLPYIPMSSEDLSKSILYAIVNWAEKEARLFSTVRSEVRELFMMEMENFLNNG